MPKQLRLTLSTAPNFRRADFVVSPVNRDAVRALDAWPTWPLGVLALIGPEGSGKTHLAMDWAAQVGAVVSRPGDHDLSPVSGCPILIEDAEGALGDDALFHLLNLAAAGQATVLITARRPPAFWPCVLPDLRSRLNGLTVAMLGDPDDAVLEGVFRNLFRAHHIRPNEDVYPYLAARMERSVTAARKVVTQLDEAGAAQGRDITRALAKQILENQPETLDLFE